MRNYDRILAIVMGIVFLGLGVLVVKKSLGLSGEFIRREISGTADYGINGEDSAKAASVHLGKDLNRLGKISEPIQLIPLYSSAGYGFSQFSKRIWLIHSHIG